MAKTASAIRFEPEEKEWITAFAKMNGSTFSAQVRQWTLERLEDELDAAPRRALERTMARVSPGTRPRPTSGWRSDWATRSG